MELTLSGIKCFMTSERYYKLIDDSRAVLFSSAWISIAITVLLSILLLIIYFVYFLLSHKKIRIISILKGLFVLFLFVFSTVVVAAWVDIRFNHLKVRGGYEDYIIIHKERELDKISDFFKERYFKLADFSSDELLKSVRGIKRIERLDNNFYLLETGRNLFLFGIPEGLLEIPKDGQKEYLWDIVLYRGDILLCDARPKGYFEKNHKKVETFVVSRFLLDNRSDFKSVLPPVPGCIYHDDYRQNKDKIEYPDIARKRFKLYYPELAGELEALEYMVPVDR